MAAEFGHFALILALCVCVIQTVVPAVGTFRNDGRAMALAGSCAQAQFLLLLFAFGCLAWCFWHNDFSVDYVATNSHSALPVQYRLSAIWGAHEGSLLLWSLMLSGWTFAVSCFNRQLPAELTALVLSVLGALGVGFLLFMLLTSNPFDRSFPFPTEGRDLNPLLQDPGLIFHPPMLYMGYVGFSVAFAFSVAALVLGRLDSAWARWTRPWTTAAWSFLTLGITLGSWWAYHELGWGGWWFWDPVENASFMPWLVGTALIHSLAVTEKRGQLKSWTVLLALLAFALSLLGTFLVRSGILVSVHSFAVDPARGLFILVFLGVVVGTALSLYAWRAPRLVADGELHFLSREGLLLFNNVFLLSAAAAVFLGTLYPLVLETMGLGKVSVGPPYFNAVFVPLMAPLALLVGLSWLMPWRKVALGRVLRGLRIPAATGLVAGLLLPWLLHGRFSLAAAAGSCLALWTLASAVSDVARRWRRGSSIGAAGWGMTMAHFGFGLLVLGVSNVSVFSQEKDVSVVPGQSVAFAGHDWTFVGVGPVQGPNFSADRGLLQVHRNGRLVAELEPEKRYYPVQKTVMTESAVHYTLWRDLYVSLGESLGEKQWSLRLYYRPMMRLVWLGGLVAFLGGLLAISDRRYRLRKVLPAAVVGAA